jgi:hypothetical protein
MPSEGFPFPEMRLYRKPNWTSPQDTHMPDKDDHRVGLG